MIEFPRRDVQLALMLPRRIVALPIVVLARHVAGFDQPARNVPFPPDRLEDQHVPAAERRTRISVIIVAYGVAEVDVAWAEPSLIARQVRRPSCTTTARPT